MLKFGHIKNIKKNLPLNVGTEKDYSSELEGKKTFCLTFV